MLPLPFTSMRQSAILLIHGELKSKMPAARTVNLALSDEQQSRR
jgi:hypothetical protein